MEKEYKHLGDHSSAPPWASKYLVCHDCKVSWIGCWDNFMCPQCKQGEIPWSDSTDLTIDKIKNSTKDELRKYYLGEIK